jgi:hypothetical protein
MKCLTGFVVVEHLQTPNAKLFTVVHFAYYENHDDACREECKTANHGDAFGKFRALGEAAQGNSNRQK